MGVARVYLVGAGPGDPGLLTLRGRDVLGRADVVVYDALIAEPLLDLAPGGAERVYVGKRSGRHAMSQDGINQLLIDRARAGKTVVRLKGGDPFIFGRGGEEALAMAAAGVRFEVVPGVTAATAAAACAGIPLTHRGLAGSVALITGHQAAEDGDAELDWPSLASWRGTLAFYMGVANLAGICRKLIAHGLPADTPAAVIHWGATPRQKVASGTVESLPARAEEAKIAPPALIVIGNVVALREKLRWFESRPLFGKRIAVTRARPQASELAALLEAAGAEVITCPTIRIAPTDDPQPLKQAAAEIGTFDWLVLTSVNGVDALWTALQSHGLDARALAGCRIAVVGPATAERLAVFGLRADLQPQTYTTAALAEELRSACKLKGKRVLCPRSDAAPPDLSDALAAAGAQVTEVVAYRTVPDHSGARPVLEMLEADGLHWLTFTSSSTVTNFLAAVDARRVARSSVRIASIGPVTSRAIRSAGLSVAVEAENHTVHGLAEAIIAVESSRKDG
ncbi:MAG TPA: uroporphyrinogen-III C-methyltransferase [Phycisphaerae bacterium]|nr:uroporphyrinogen-III C-methyltransferase [Phycisphaerae bacterium]